MRRLPPLSITLPIGAFFLLNLLAISSFAPELFLKQLLAWIISIILFFLGQEINPKLSSRHQWLFFISSCIFLLIPILLNNFVRGSRRWINIAGATLQPSEIVKPFLLLFIANSSFPYFHLIPVFIIIFQPDLGSAITNFSLLIPSILYQNKLLKISIIIAILSILFSPIIWKFGLKDYQKSRIETFINPQADPLGEGYNLIQSQIAIGSAGFFGKGYRQGSQGQLLYLPEKHTDFIFAAITEELGLITGFLIISIYLWIGFTLLSKAFTIINNTPLFIFTLGIVFQIWVQSFINIGMNLGIMPVTGIPLPFLSVGGSSIMALMLSLGIVYSDNT